MLTLTGVTDQLAEVTEIRDSIELVHTSEYGTFLAVLFQPFAYLLQTTQPVFLDCPTQKLRNLLLEIFSRCLPSDLHKDGHPKWLASMR